MVPKCVLLLGGGDGSTGISSFLFSHHSTPPPSPVYSLCPLLCTSSLEYHYPTTSTFNFLHPFQKPLSLSHWNSLHLTKKCSISSTSPLPHSTHLFLSSNSPADPVCNLNLHLIASCPTIVPMYMYLSTLNPSFTALYHLRLLLPTTAVLHIDLFNAVDFHSRLVALS